MHGLPPGTIESFYRAAVLGLRALEAREARGLRFGEAARASWRALGGELEDRDRLDLLLRDAAASSALAFSPRLVFELGSLTEDEPFGPEWPQASPGLAASLLRDASASGVIELDAVLPQAAAQWGIQAAGPSPALADAVAGVGPRSRIVLAGASAVVALARHGMSRRDLDLADQVLFVAASPAERQLFGLALLLSGTRARPRALSPANATFAHARELAFPRVDVALVSDDVDPAARAAVAELKATLGA